MQIICNNKPRQKIYGYQLTDKQKADFDYIEDIDYHDFFVYKGNIYDIDEFMQTPDNLKLLGFDGYISESYFSGILIKICQDSDYIIVARYYS